MMARFIQNLREKQVFTYIAQIKSDGQKVRFYIQMLFFITVVWIGFQFYGFVRYLETGGESLYFSRPPGVEGFLPISALISFKYWLLTGVFNNVHPSGLVIFILIIILGLFLKKSFCSYICPVGLISESLWQMGQKIFKRNIRVWRWLDNVLRSLKYILLLFFLWAVLVQMDVISLEKFIYSPYNRVADIKMLYFFTKIDAFALWTLIILVVFSVLIKNFWCRYLCPYGALLGFLSIFSPLKITRNEETCTDCEACTDACPHAIRVHTRLRVISDECTACGLCLAACPEQDTLDLKISGKGKAIPAWAFGLTVLLVFFFGTLLARLTGHWQNDITKTEYIRRIQEIDKPVYYHNRGEVPDYGPGD